MKRKSYDSDPLPFSMEHDQYVSGTRDMVYVLQRTKDRPSLKDGINFVASDNPKTKQIPQYDGEIEYRNNFV